MTKPVTIPNTFATATTAIPLSQLDSDFSTVATALNDANTYSNYAADTGVANAYVVTLTGVSTTYSAGLRIQFKAGAANTGASTLNVNGGGTKNITFQDASALSSGTIAANAIVDVMYDGTQFLLMNDPAGTVGTGDVVGPAGATANAVVRFDSTTGKLVKNSVVTIADSTGDVAGVGALTASGNVSFDGGTFVFNESGADKDFRIEGDTDANLFFTDASTDRVGIGTSSPGAQLQLNKSGTGDYTTFRLSNSGASGKTYEIGVGGNAAAAGYANNLYFYDSTAASLRMTLDSSGNLGLGVTPSAWYTSSSTVAQVRQASFYAVDNSALEIVNNAFLTSGGSNWNYLNTGYATRYNSSNGIHRWYYAGSGTGGTGPISWTQAMTLDASGNLGVGTTSPGNTLSVNLIAGISGSSGGGATVPSASHTSSSTLRIGLRGSVITSDNAALTTIGTYLCNNVFFRNASGNPGYLTTNPASAILLTDDTIIFRRAASGTANTDITFSESARITSGGDLLVGTTSASLTADNGIKLNADNRLSVVNSGSVEGFIYYNTAASAYRFYVSGNGTISATNTTISAISDQRFKENVQDLDVGLDAVMALKPRKFDWKAGKGKDKKDDRGFIAQEFEQVFPDLIDEWKDPAPEGEEPYKSVRQDLIPVLVKAIQEQQALITSLTARVAALEGTQP